MALSLPIPSDYGVDATYHRIAAAQINWHDQACTLVLFSYVSKAAREAGLQPLGTLNLTFSGAEFDFEHDEITRAALYDKLKERAEWTAATDI